MSDFDTTPSMNVLPLLPEHDSLVLTTRRLDLLPISRHVAEPMFKVLNDPSLYVFTGGSPPPDVESLRRLYEFWENRLSPDGSELWLNWAVRLRADEVLIGHIQAGVRSDHANMAWTLGSPWQRHGYATEAATIVLEWLVQLGVDEIRASINPAHAASVRVAERLGLQRTAEMSGTELIWKRRAILIVRESLAEDEPEATDIERLAMTDLRKVYRPTPAASRGRMALETNLRRLVAVLGGRVVGTVKFHVVGDGLFLLALGVHPMFRRRGIASALVERLEKIAVDSGCRSVILHTVRETGNVAIFERMGFWVE